LIRTLKNLAAECRGAAAVEFGFVAPILIFLAVSTAQFGLILSNYIMLTEAVSSGTRVLAACRDSAGSTICATPRTATVNMVKGAAPSLVPADITVTTRINGTACATDTACQTALSAAGGLPASVTATYPCNLIVNWWNFAAGCTLSSTTTERIQ
jgi:Flp pilus assembly protein TadG